MIHVATHIQYLITQHDCVIIPGFGALIAHYQPARIDQSTSMFYPPSRIVVFNPAIDHDDALIASSIAHRENMPYESAARLVSDFVIAMRHQLDAEHNMTIKRVGTFRLSEDHRILFDPAEDNIANAQYFGLPQLPVTVLDHTAYSVAGNAEIPESPAVLHISLGRRILRVAASVTVLVALGLTLSTPISISTADGIDLAGIGIGGKTKTTESPEDSFKLLPDRSDAMLLLDVPDSTAATATVKPRKKPLATPEATGHRYFLIVASLETKSKAEQYLKRHASENYNLIEGQGRYRIYAASGNSIEEASLLMKDTEFRNAHPDAWVHRSR